MKGTGDFSSAMRAARTVIERHRVALVFLLALVGAAVPRVWALFYDDSVYYPDEIFQTLEQAHRAAFGYGFIPWEFREAARSWLLPGALSLVLRMGSALGIAGGFGLAHFAKGFMVLLSLAGGYATLQLARDRGGLRAAMLAGALYASLPPLVVFGARCMTETASVPAIAFAAWWLLGARRGGWRAFGAGLLLGVAVFLRPQNGLAALTFFAALLANRRWRDARALAAGGLVAALVFGGLLDWLTWGAPFRSLIVYLRFNLLEGKASLWGTSPWWFYLLALRTSCGPLVAVVAVGLVVAAPRERELLSVALVYVLVHSIIPHKQLRFLTPVIPIALAAAAVGLVELLRRVRSSIPWPGAGVEEGAAAALALVLAIGFGIRASTDGYADFGAPGRGSVWKDADGATLLIADLGRRADLCGLMLDGIDRGYTGAYGYLHRDVPFFNDTKPDAQASANYLIGLRGHGLEGYEVVDTRDTFSLLRRDGKCEPPPARFTYEMGEDPMKR